MNEVLEILAIVGIIASAWVVAGIGYGIMYYFTKDR